MPLDEPLVVVAFDKSADYGSCRIECLEAVHVEALLLQGAHEALNDTIALGFSHKCRSGADVRPGELPLKLDCGVLRSPVVPESKSQGDLGSVGSKVRPYPLANGLECCPAVSPLGHIVPHDLSRAVVNSCKEPAPSLALGVEARPVSALELIGPLGTNATAAICHRAHVPAAPEQGARFLA